MKAKRGLDLVREDVPNNIARIADERMKPRIRAAALQVATGGTLNLASLARDAYLQGVFDVIERPQKRAAGRPETASKGADGPEG